MTTLERVRSLLTEGLVAREEFAMPIIAVLVVTAQSITRDNVIANVEAMNSGAGAPAVNGNLVHVPMVS